MNLLILFTILAQLADTLTFMMMMQGGTRTEQNPFVLFLLQYGLPFAISMKVLAVIAVLLVAIGTNKRDHWVSVSVLLVAIFAGTIGAISNWSF